MTIERFRMERYQSLHWHEVDYDLSESGVLPMTIRELMSLFAGALNDLGGYVLEQFGGSYADLVAAAGSGNRLFGPPRSHAREPVGEPRDRTRHRPAEQDRDAE